MKKEKEEEEEEEGDEEPMTIAMAEKTTTNKKTKRSTKAKKYKKKKKKKKNKKLSISQEELTNLISAVTSATSLSHTFLSQNDLLLLPSQTLTVESFIKSTALSLSNLLSLQTLNLKPPSLPPPPTPLPTSSWFHRLLSSSLSDTNTHFVENFRLSKPSFHILLQTLSPSLQSPAELALAAALFRLSHAAPYKSVAHRFGIDSAAACRAFYQVCKAVIDRLSHLFDLSPHRLSCDFGGLPNCCSVLGYSRFFTDLGLGSDGTVVVQGLVDSQGRFIDVSAGWPGWMTPEAIFQQTKLYSRVTDGKELLNGASFDLAGGNSIGPYMLGDSCCPLLPWLLTPYPKWSEAKSDAHVLFNSAHGRGMELANTAFGRVLARWRLLSTRWKQECLEFFPFVVVAGCLLHNFLIDCGEPAPEDTGDYVKEQRFPEFHGKEDESGEKARDALALHLSMGLVEVNVEDGNGSTDCNLESIKIEDITPITSAKPVKDGDLVEVVDVSPHFSTDEVFETREGMSKWVRDLGLSIGIIIVVLRSDLNQNGRTPRLLFGCGRGGNHRSSRMKADDQFSGRWKGTKRCGCPFKLRGIKMPLGDQWKIRVECGIHNHPLVEHFKGHSFVGRLSESEKQL